MTKPLDGDANSASNHEFLEQLLALRDANGEQMHGAHIKVESPAQLAQLMEALMSRSYFNEGDGMAIASAMSLVAVAAMRLLLKGSEHNASMMGHADLDILRRTRCFDGPVLVIPAEDALYPQNDLHERLDSTLAVWRPFLRAAARAKLAADDARHAQWEAEGKRKPFAWARGRAHWKELAKEDDIVPPPRNAWEDITS